MRLKGDKMKKYLRVWLLMTLNSVQNSFASRSGAIVFVLGKVIRFVLFFFLLVLVVGKTNQLAGYSLDQVIFFFLTFTLVDSTAQFLFREAYRFRPLLVSGDFDLVLAKPVHPLLRVLLGGADVLDLITLIPLLGLIFYFAQRLGPIGPPETVLYLLLVLNAFLIATAFHIFVLASGILTMAVDHTILIYRDLTAMGRIPIDFYREPIRSLLTFGVPVGIMMTVPAKAIMGLLDWRITIYAFLFGIVLIIGSLKFWNWSLKKYSSASS